MYIIRNILFSIKQKGISIPGMWHRYSFWKYAIMLEAKEDPLIWKGLLLLKLFHQEADSPQEVPLILMFLLSVHILQRPSGR